MPPTFTDLQRGFELGPWTVLPERGLLRQGEVEEHLEPKVMDVLVVLASRQGGVVTRDQLVDAVWDGRATADEAIVAKIATLRNKLQDDSKNPEYIETVPRRGYRLKMPVALTDAPEPERRSASYLQVPRPILVAGLAALAIAVIIWWPTPPKPIDSVAVLQFKNLSDEKEKFQYVVDGFREELVISLNQVPNLSFTRGPELSDDRTARMIAKELGVGAIVTGSLRTDGDRIRITAELISADRFQIWSGRFDGAAGDVFSLQENVATEVRDAIRGEKGEQIRTASPPAKEAFEKYLQGRYFLAKRDVESLQHAQFLFQKSKDIDPNFGPVYVRLAITHLLLSEYDLEQRLQFFDHAIKVVDQGIKADPSIRAPAAMIYGFVHHQLGEWAEAAEAFATAFSGVTIYPTAYQWHSRLLGALGQLDRSLEQATAARAMEPASPVNNSRVAISYFWINDMVNARFYFEEANKMVVGAPIHHFAYTIFLIRDNRLEDARASTKFALDMLQAEYWWVDPVFDGLAHPGDQEMLDIAFETIGKMTAAGVPPYITMTLWALFEQGDRAMEVAMQVAESGTLYELEVIYLDEFKELREHEDFPELLQALGLTDYWGSIGCRWNNDQLLCDAA